MKDSLEKFLRAIGGLIEDDASIKEILGRSQNTTKILQN